MKKKRQKEGQPFFLSLFLCGSFHGPKLLRRELMLHHRTLERVIVWIHLTPSPEGMRFGTVPYDSCKITIFA